MHRPFKIIFNDDELDLAGDSFIIVMFWQDVWPKSFTPCGRRIDDSGHSIKDALSIIALANRYNSIFDNRGREEKKTHLEETWKQWYGQ